MNTLLISRFTRRKSEVQEARPPRFAAVERATDELSARVVDAATVELLMEAALGATALAFERDDFGQLLNVDGRTGRVLYPLPWGRMGHKRWGITPAESNQLRKMMQDRQAAAALWLYDRTRRAWYINRQAARTWDQAAAYWESAPITVGELRRARAALVGRQMANRVGR